MFLLNFLVVVLTNCCDVVQAALVNLHVNTKLAPLLPYFVNFVSNGVSLMISASVSFLKIVFLSYQMQIIYLKVIICDREVISECVVITDLVNAVHLLQVRTVSHDTAQLIRLLHTVKALVTNMHLYLEPKPYVCIS